MSSEITRRSFGDTGLRELLPSLPAAARACSVVAFVLLIAGGAAVRYAGIRDTFVSFHSTRQYHCALIARGIYYELALPPDEPRRKLAAHAAEEGLLEPPITEAVVAVGYFARGGEHLGVARAITATFWLIAAVLLYRFAAQLLSTAAALWALAYFVFLPYGIVASQSFQPEPLTLACMLGGWCALLAYHRRPSWRRMALAAGIAGLALLAKPVSVFSLGALHLALLDRNRSLWSGLKRADTWLLPLLIGLPGALFYLPHVFGGGRLSGQADLSFRPELWSTLDFWLNWKKMLWRASGETWPLMAAAAGVVLARAGRPRRCLIALWLSYLAYGMTFSYHISSHDYYQLPALPIVGLSIAALAERLRWITRMRPAQPARNTAAAAIRLGFAVSALWLALQVSKDVRADAFPRTHLEPGDETVYRDIGRLVQHSSRVVFLTPNAYGKPLMFYGELSGWNWPTIREIQHAVARGKTVSRPAQRLDDLKRQGAEFFVVTPASELQTQRRLQAVLRPHSPVVAETSDYAIFDLRASR